MFSAAFLYGLTIFFIVLLVSWLWKPTSRLRKGRLISKRITDDKEPTSTAGEGIVKKTKISEIPAIKAFLDQHHSSKELALLIKRSHLNVSVSVFLLFCFILGSFCFMFIRLYVSPIYALAFSLAATMIPVLYLFWRRKMYQERFVNHLPDGLAIISNSIKVGHGLEAAIEACARTAPDPVSAEFQDVRAELQLGQDLVSALRNLHRRIRTIDVKILMTGIALHTELGGNLSEILDNLAATIRERIALKREINALSAQGKLSALVLFGIPFAFALFWLFMDRQAFFEFAASDKGRRVLLFSVACQSFAFLWMMWIVRLRD